ncbi:UNVERIFIED_CONTAM: hypothetical protein Slati_1073100 [Sesamum latifolium]|uniref:Inosine/uridine-preferring nucleoside hydrolase domain-containing protein n=1 Tax=Sesamum latifolium TaxID=2727402 RepID=A0AAW2XT44_9LAMI
MILKRCVCICVCVVIIGLIKVYGVEGLPHRILLDTDVDTDDFFALLYILKLNRSEFDLQAVTINTNGWSNAGHAVNHLYDVLYMMGRDDISVGVGGEGGILEDGTILPNVGGYHPIIEQGNTTAGYCRYRQAIPVGVGGKLDIDTNFGVRKSFLPQGSRRYTSLRQPTAQQVMIDKISAGPITVFIIGSNTNFGIFLMSNPHLKRNVKHIYIMGGGVRSRNPTGCCPKNSTSSCRPGQCGDRGNIFTDYTSNPYAEFNIFGDPFAAYQVIHSGIPVTLVPLDATNTIPLSSNFYEEFEKNQHTYEAQYCFKSLKMAHDTWFGDQFFTCRVTLCGTHFYLAWLLQSCSRATTVMAERICRNGIHEYHSDYFKRAIWNIRWLKSILDSLKKPKFNLKRNGVHSGHVQTGLRDPFCIVKNGKGRCKYHLYAADKLMFLLYRPQIIQDGYTAEVSGQEGLRVLVAAILVTPTGWANAATIDVVYDLLHMMGRDDIPVGLGDVFALNQSDLIFPAVGDCKYSRAIPYGSGGFLDSDTLYGLARTQQKILSNLELLDTDHPELRQPLALEIWESVITSLESGSKVTILTNGPLTNVAKIILSDKNLSYPIQDIFIVGGHFSSRKTDKGNVINIPSNEYAELNMFLDPLAAETVLGSGHNIIPLNVNAPLSLL